MKSTSSNYQQLSTIINKEKNMNKPTGHFKLSATTKYLLSTITNDYERHTFRQNMIQAQLESEKKPVKEDKKK